MTLLLIILSLVGFSFVSNYFSKYNGIFAFISILFVLSSYFILSFQCSNGILLNKETAKYNLQTKAFKNNKLFLFDSKDFNNETIEILHRKDIYENYSQYFYNIEIRKIFDLSYYKNKVYLYFGITPILLIYLPYNLIFDYYISDSLAGFFLSSLIFILSLIILRNFNRFFLCYKIKPFYENLSIFLIGFCNYTVILVIKIEIYEISSISAAVLLLLSILLFMKYLLATKQSTKYKLTFIIGLLLSLAVGCRPHYVLFIPIFFLLIIFIEFKNKQNNNIFKSIICFLIPCIIYGFIIATYNYLRFDSIFEFGWKYQLNSHNQFDFVPTFKDFLLGIQYHLFKMPNIVNDLYTAFSFCFAKGHRIASEFGVGIIYNCPISLLILSLLLFFKKIKNKNIISIIVLLLILFIINFNVACVFGIMRRYAFEYLYIINILALITFYLIEKDLNNKKQKNIILVFFIILFVYTVYINICLLFCLHNSLMFIDEYNNKFYTKVINFLFNTNLPNDYLINKSNILEYISQI